MSILEREQLNRPTNENELRGIHCNERIESAYGDD